MFEQACLEPTAEIARRLKKDHPDIPIIAFPKGAGPLYTLYTKVDAFDGLSIDTGLPWAWALENISPYKTVQGGLDPLLVVKGGEEMVEAARMLRDTFKDVPYIFNLGHGFVPHTPPEHVADLMTIIREKE